MSLWQAMIRIVTTGTLAAFAACAAAANAGVPAVADTVASPAAATAGASVREKAYSVGGALTLSLPVSYLVSNPDGTVELQVGRLQNDSTTTTSGTIRLMLFVTTTPIVSGAGFSYNIVGQYTLSPLAPLNYYDSLDVTVPLNTAVPDGIYYVYIGAFEYELSCGSASGYCSDDYIQFTNQLQVVNGSYYTYSPVGPATATAVEYYWASRDHYFFTANPAEIAALDASPPGGWVRTGYTWGAYATAVAGSTPVCRFYIPPLYGDSHFYSASPAECAAVRAAYPMFTYEAPNVTYLILPDTTTGECPPGTDPVYRLFNNRVDTNHRYTTSIAVRALMISRGYTPEGYGPYGVAACAPR